ncbi:hypothetical protein EH196_06890 [Bacillus sp. C1-1]|nr:hypothetical protein EH196_06890 [Bacillus sp. C1-1]
MYRFNKWIDSLILALVGGGVYLTMSFIHDDPVKWINALAVASALFLTWTLLIPRFQKTREAKK